MIGDAGGYGGYELMVREGPGGRQGFDKGPEGQDRVDEEDQDKGEGDILLPGGDDIVPSGGVTEPGG